MSIIHPFLPRPRQTQRSTLADTKTGAGDRRYAMGFDMVWGATALCHNPALARLRDRHALPPIEGANRGLNNH